MDSLGSASNYSPMQDTCLNDSARVSASWRSGVPRHVFMPLRTDLETSLTTIRSSHVALSSLHASTSLSPEAARGARGTPIRLTVAPGPLGTLALAQASPRARDRAHEEERLALPPQRSGFALIGHAAAEAECANRVRTPRYVGAWSGLAGRRRDEPSGSHAGSGAGAGRAQSIDARPEARTGNCTSSNATSAAACTPVEPRWPP